MALGGLSVSPAAAQVAAAPPPDSQFQKVVIDDSPGEPMDLAVLPDGRVLHVTRQGHVWLHDPDTGLKTLAAQLDVYQHDEEGLQNIALDPNFERNGWIYLYYSPPLDTPVDDPATPTVNEGDAPEFGTPEEFAAFEGVIRLSRFQWDERTDTIDLGSEEEILDVPVDRGICCHVGGDIVFDGDGNLYLSTGDDTNPFQSDGYTPIDEREGRNPAFDAQRTAANTNDLRGKILRITPTEGGGYTIPDGNLFEDSDPLTRPEIYLMGLRNPFRIEYNLEEGELYVADYSPDAQTANPLRGPAGQGKWFIATEPGYYGWPYCATAELPYVDYDFATGVSGEPFDCANLVNESPHNTGLTDLPPVTQPQVWYSYGLSAQFPELETGGIGPMAGPAYQFDRKATHGRNPTAWPEYYDNVPLFFEWTRDYIKEFRLDASRTEVAEINDVLASFDLQNPMDIEFGPDGSLYVLNYGNGFFGQNQPGAELVRIDYLGASRQLRSDGEHRGRHHEWARSAHGQLHERRERPREPEAPLRVGLQRGRQGRLARVQPHLHVHRERRVQRDAQGDRPGWALRDRLRDDHRRQHATGCRVRHSAGRRCVRLRRCGAVRGQRDGRPAGRLLARAGDLHPGSRHARPPADDGVRLHRHDPDLVRRP